MSSHEDYPDCKCCKVWTDESEKLNADWEAHSDAVFARLVEIAHERDIALADLEAARHRVEMWQRYYNEQRDQRINAEHERDEVIAECEKWKAIALAREGLMRNSEKENTIVNLIDPASGQVVGSFDAHTILKSNEEDEIGTL